MEHLRAALKKNMSHGHAVDSSIYFGCLPKTPIPKKMPTFQNISGVFAAFFWWGISKPKPSLLSQHPGKPPWAPRKAVYAPFAQVQSHEAVGLPFEFWSGDEIQRRLQFDLQSYGPQVFWPWVGIGRWKLFVFWFKQATK